jgi:myo-inositol-1(or 4)-monophosphatase
MPNANADVDLLREAAREAGALALEYRRRGLKIWSKGDAGPVTDADQAADDLLKQRLRSARPDYGWLSEETVDGPERLTRPKIFVVDPIDGTVAFMKSKPWWTVALSVVEHGRPTAAVVFAPALNEIFEAAAGGGAKLNGETIQASDATSLDDASMLADAALFNHPIWPDPWPVMRLDKRNSIAYRMALVGAGVFDAAMALSPKWDWDVAAGALIAEEAGGKCTDHLGRRFRFNRPDPRQPSLVCSAPALHPLILKRCAPISLPDLL